MLKLSKRY